MICQWWNGSDTLVNNSILDYTSLKMAT